MLIRSESFSRPERMCGVVVIYFLWITSGAEEQLLWYELPYKGRMRSKIKMKCFCQIRFASLTPLARQNGELGICQEIKLQPRLG